MRPVCRLSNGPSAERQLRIRFGGFSCRPTSKRTMPSARSAKLVGVLVRCGKELIQFSRATSSMSVNHELSTLKSTVLLRVLKVATGHAPNLCTAPFKRHVV